MSEGAPTAVLDTIPPDQLTPEQMGGGVPPQAPPQEQTPPVTPPIPAQRNPAELSSAPAADPLASLEKDLRLQVVDVSTAARANGNDAAAEYINDKTTDGGVRGFIKKVWYGNLTRDYHVNTQRAKAIEQAKREQNVFAAVGGTKQDHQRATEAVVGRFTDDFIHTDAGEVNDLQKTTAGVKLQAKLRGMVLEYARGDIDDAVLTEKKVQALAEFGQSRKAEDRNKGSIFADNIEQMARNAKLASETAEGLRRVEAVLAAGPVGIGEAVMGVRTEAKWNAVEKMTDKLYQSKIGSLVNETTLAAAAGVVMVGAKLLSRKGVSAAAVVATGGLGAAVVGGLSAAGLGGIREGYHVEQDRRYHFRQMAQGGNEHSRLHGKRRESLEASRYDTVPANDLIANLHTKIAEVGNGADGLRGAVDSLLGAQARCQISDRQKEDLIDFSAGIGSEESERWALDIAMDEAKVAIRHALGSIDDASLKEANIPHRDIDALLEEGVEGIVGTLQQEMSEKDAVYNKLRMKRMAGMGVVSLVSSEGIKVATQLAAEHGGELIDMVRERFSSGGRGAAVVGGHENVSTGGHSSVEVPAGYHLTHEKSGAWELFDGKNNVVDPNVTFDANGHLSEASRTLLEGKGFGAGEHTGAVAGSVAEPAHTVSAKDLLAHVHEYNAAHPHEQFTRVHRELWYDNNTVKFDHNELKLDWGGENGQIGDNYAMDVSHMLNNGSTHGSLSAHAQQLIHEGRMKVAVSVTEGTQSHAVLVPVNEHGQVLIAKDSLLGRSLFGVDSAGHPHFKGAFAEAVELTKLHHGVQNMRVLATVHGDHSVHELLVPATTPEQQIITTLTAPSTESGGDGLFVPLPLYGRGGLERGNKQTLHEGYGYYGYYGSDYAKKYWQNWEEERSPRLRADPNAVLNPGEELAWYEGRQKEIRGQEYVDEINGYVQADEVLKSIGSETRAVVCIPVAAANESENIYRTLELFARQQDPESIASSIVFLNLNWKRDLERDPASVEKIQKTISEVERARAAFPELRIATMQKVWEPEFVAEKEGRIYGEVIKVLYDAAAFAMNDAVKNGRRSSDEESLLITNDADTEGMSRNYLRNYIKALVDNPDVDAFSGTVRRGTESYKQFPGYGAASNFYALLNMVNQRKIRENGTGGFTTEGPNSALKMSSYVAMGGVEDRIGAGADAVLSQRLHAARTTPPSLETWRSKMVGRHSSDTDSDEQPARAVYVHGASVDTLPDRLLGAYRQGKWIASGWDNFDAGGYEGREASMQAGTLHSEDAERDIDAIIERLEVNIEGFASNWYTDPGVVETSLALWFGKSNPTTSMYTSSWDWNNEGKPKFSISITDAGKQVLKRRMKDFQSGKINLYSGFLRA